MPKRSFLICATREAGHLLPMLGVAQELVRRGHEVVVYGAESSGPSVAASGARLLPNERFDQLDIVSRMRKANRANAGLVERTPALAREFVGRRVRELNFRREIVAVAEEYAVELRDLLRKHPFDLVIGDTFAFGAALGAELAGVPFATQAGDPTFSLNDRGTLAMPPRRALEHVPGGLWRASVDAALPVAGLRRRLHLPAQPFTAAFYGLMVSSRLHLVPAYPGFMRLPPAPGHVFVGPVSFTPPSARASVNIPLDRSTVLVTGSTTGHGKAVETLHKVVAALSRTSLRVVVSVGAIGGLDIRSPNIHVAEGFAPHDEMIPQVGVLVTHGGWGAVGTALRAGTPMIVTPSFGPQPMIGERLEELSLARCVPFDRLDPHTLESSVRFLLESASVRTELQRTKSQLAGMNSAALAADALVALARA